MLTNQNITDIHQRAERNRQFVERLKHYINTYDTQLGYLTYDDTTLVNDLLYGIGIALDEEKFQYADGFQKFKQELVEFLNDQN